MRRKQRQLVRRVQKHFPPEAEAKR
jgi:hypothetical protein